MSSIVVFADWGTHPKAIELHLFHSGKPFDYQGSFGATNWNWPIEESVYYPGARFVFINAEDVQTLCGFSVAALQSVGDEINYSIDLDALFHCVDGLTGIGPGGTNVPMFDEPLPQTSDIPITAVSWATEGSGKDGGVWVDVHNMRMVSENQALATPATADEAVALPTPSSASQSEYGAIPAAILDRVNALCDAEAGCASRAYASRQRNPPIHNQVTPDVAREAAFQVYGVTLYTPLAGHQVTE